MPAFAATLTVNSMRNALITATVDDASAHLSVLVTALWVENVSALCVAAAGWQIRLSGCAYERWRRNRDGLDNGTWCNGTWCGNEAGARLCLDGGGWCGQRFIDVDIFGFRCGDVLWVGTLCGRIELGGGATDNGKS